MRDHLPSLIVCAGIGLASFLTLACQEKKKSKPPQAAQNSPLIPADTTYSGNSYSYNSYSGTPATYAGTDCTTTANCPQATDLNITESGNMSSTLSAIVGTQVNWSFTASSSTYSRRTFVVYSITAINRPPAMTIQNNLSTMVNIMWMPTASDPANGNLEVRARDISRCRIFEANDSDCEDYSTSHTQYETVRTIQWNLQGGGQMVSNTTGGSGFISMLPTLLPVVFSALSGNGLDIGGLSSALIAAFGRGGNTINATTYTAPTYQYGATNAATTLNATYTAQPPVYPATLSAQPTPLQ